MQLQSVGLEADWTTVTQSADHVRFRRSETISEKKAVKSIPVQPEKDHCDDEPFREYSVLL
jgi:hypothetical protein